MESTGVYWRPVFNLLDDAGRTLVLVNPQHLKAGGARAQDGCEGERVAG
jgi:transposase